MSQYRIISICKKTNKSLSFINCTQEGASLISKRGAVKKKMRNLFQNQGHTNKMDSEYLENYVWIYAHASDLGESVVLWGICSFAVATIKYTVWRWSNKL